MSLAGARSLGVLGGVIAALSLALAPLAAATPAEARVSGARDFVPGQVLVRYRPFTSPTDREAVRSRGRFELRRHLPLGRLELLDLPPGSSVRGAVTGLEADPHVAYAEPNYIARLHSTTPNDPYFGGQWGLNNTGQAPFDGNADADVDAPEAWDFTTGMPTVKVALADTGVIFSQPDLSPNLRSGGYDFISGDGDPTDPMAGTGAGHGTFVAGVIGAAGNNSYGVAGVAWYVGIEPMRVCDSAGCPDSALIQAIGLADAQGVPLFNASLGGSPYNQAVKDAIDAAQNTLFVFSAGNTGTNLDTTPSYPCSYASTNVICVAATDARDQLWSNSNYGAASVDLGAPGVDVVSTNADYASNPIQGASGTSAAAPFVTGAAALILSVSPGMTPADVKAKILANVDPLTTLAGKTTTGGRLNVDRLVPDPPVQPGPNPPAEPGAPSGTQPQTRIIRGPKRRTSKRRATFTLASDPPGARFSCALDGPVYRACRSPLRLTHLRSGPHTLRVIATDPAGNNDTSPAVWRWKVAG